MKPFALTPPDVETVVDEGARVVLRFTVFGRAQPGGSKKAFTIRKGGKPTGRIAVVDANPNVMPWRQQIASVAAEHMQGELLAGPLSLTVRFYVQRPKGHYCSGVIKGKGIVRRGAPAYPATRPDLTKLVRALEDALTGCCWIDDAQIVVQSLQKRFGDPQRVEVEIGELL